MRAPLQLDFRSAPRSSWRAIGWVMLIAAALCAAAVAVEREDANRLREEAQRRHDALDLRRREREVHRSVVASVDPQTLADIKRANVVIEQLAVPWDALFAAVESAQSRHLGLLSLTPNARESTLRIAGESRSIDELLAYVDRIAAQPVFSQAHLLAFGVQERDGVSVVAFTLAATWRQQP